MKFSLDRRSLRGDFLRGFSSSGPMLVTCSDPMLGGNGGRTSQKFGGFAGEFPSGGLGLAFQTEPFQNKLRNCSEKVLVRQRFCRTFG